MSYRFVCASYLLTYIHHTHRIHSCDVLQYTIQQYLVRCALYGINEEDRCPNWREGIYTKKQCSVGGKGNESQNNTTTDFK